MNRIRSQEGISYSDAFVVSAIIHVTHVGTTVVDAVRVVVPVPVGVSEYAAESAVTHVLVFNRAKSLSLSER